MVEQELAVEGVALGEDELDVEAGIAEDLLEQGGEVRPLLLVGVQQLDRQPVGVAGLGEQLTGALRVTARRDVQRVDVLRAGHLRRQDVEGQLGQVRSAEDLLHGLPVDGEVQRLTDERVAERTVGVGAQRVDHDVRVDRPGALDDEALVAGGEQRRDLLCRHRSSRPTACRRCRR